MRVRTLPASEVRRSTDEAEVLIKHDRTAYEAALVDHCNTIRYVERTHGLKAGHIES